MHVRISWFHWKETEGGVLTEARTGVLLTSIAYSGVVDVHAALLPLETFPSPGC
jgi:hypothetical protein